MAGMNDVAFLAERYALLYSKSQSLKKGIETLKNEALDSYKIVNSRILELEKVVYTDAEGGQYKKTCLDTNTQLKSLGYDKEFVWTCLEEGLLCTIKWYMV